MKNKTVKMISSVVVLAVLCGAYFGVKTYVAKQEEQENSEDEDQATNVLTVSTPDIKSLKFIIDKKEVTFEKDGDSWVKQDETAFPVSQDKVDEAAEAISSVDADRVLENVEDLYEYGLDNPSNTITITTGEGEKTSIRVGMENESTSQYYINKDDDRETVYVVSASTVEPFMNGLYDYAQMETFPQIDASNIYKVEMKDEDSAYNLEKEEDTGLWYVSDGKEQEKADSAKMSTLTSSLGGLEYAAFVNYNSTDKEEYGLDQPYGEIKVYYNEEIEESEEDTEEASEASETSETSDDASDSEMSADSASEDGTSADGTSEDEMYADGATEDDTSTDGVSEDDDTANEPEMEQKQITINIGNEAEDDTRYVSLDDSNQVYTISEESLSQFIGKDSSDFLDLTVSYLSVNNLSQMKVDYNKESHNFNVSRETSENEDGEEEEKVSYQLDGKDIDSTSFTTFYNKITNMVGQRRLEEKFETEDPADMTVEFTDLNGDIITVDYYIYDTNFYAAVVEDKTYLVNKMTVKEMIQSYESIIGNEENPGDTSSDEASDLDVSNTSIETTDIAEEQ